MFEVFLSIYKFRVEREYPNPNPKLWVPAISGNTISGLTSGNSFNYPNFSLPELPDPIGSGNPNAQSEQALVDFMAEWRENQLPTLTELLEHWVMYFDGTLKLEGAGAAVLLISPTGEQLKYVLQIFLKVSNNEAEYEALLHGLRLAVSLGIK
jgi:hypothetical protein